ncbi:MAG: dienelactone hydrolase [Candidatus Cloacimonetes bacterium]|nr:dienelactone hydrolase [Candidatus Cloacimonadota bacterium]
MKHILILVLFLGKCLAYDPLIKNDNSLLEPVALTVLDKKRDREIPVLLYPVAKLAPVILFSHGLGGSRYNSPYLARHWQARGYHCVFIQHPGSDESVWKDKSKIFRLGALKGAASLKNYLLRVHDVVALLNQLEIWSKEQGHIFFKRLNLGKIGMTGHSFGAVTTQAVSGQSAMGGRISSFDPRIKAALAMSPSIPKYGNPESAFGSVSIPWMLMTGTHDVAIIGATDVKDRLAVFEALPVGDKYELVLHDAEHSAFSDRALPGENKPRNPNHHRVILALSTAFWDTYLKGDLNARKWLTGNGPVQVLEKMDRWQIK